MLTIQRNGDAFSHVPYSSIAGAVATFGDLVSDGEAVVLGEFALRIERFAANPGAVALAEEIYALEQQMLLSQTMFRKDLWGDMVDFVIDHYQHFQTFPGEFVVFDDDAMPAEEFDVLLPAVDGGLTSHEFDYIERQALRRNITEARKLWDSLGDVPQAENGTLDEPFLDFPRGEYPETIWKWIEDGFPKVSVAIDLMGLEKKHFSPVG